MIYTKRSLLAIFSIFLLVMVLTSSLTNSWIVDNSSTVNYGLWQHCNTTLAKFTHQVLNVDCHYRESVSAATKATRGLTILAIILATIATTYAFIGLFKKEFRNWLVSIHLLMAGVCMFIAIGVFAGHETGTIIVDRTKYFLHGWSFVLGGGSAAGCWLFAIFGFFAK